MNKKSLCLLLTCVIMFTAFIPFSEAENVTMYASDGRTRIVEAKDISAWKAVGWFESAEDAKIVTLYSMDGRTLDIPQYYRADYNAVGWYNTREEVTLTMYSMDGRSLEVFKDAAEAHNKVGWYYNISDVTIKMYDKDGNEYTIYRDFIESEKAKGLSDNKNDVMQLMFSADGRFMHVPFDKVEAHNEVGWFTSGGKVDTSKPMVAITFDDGPGAPTARVLDILEKYNVPATFFVQGKNVARYPNEMVRAVKMGCEIGNHTYSHVNLSASSTSTIAQQINATNTAVYNVTGVYPKVYRPPYGAYNKAVLNTIAMPAIMWSVDTLDWKTRNPSKTLASVKRDTKDGAIILMHDIHSPTADAVEPVVKHLLMQGFQLVTVSDLIKYRQGHAVSGKVYNSLAPR